jgi:hypothetical protein
MERGDLPLNIRDFKPDPFFIRILSITIRASEVATSQSDKSTRVPGIGRFSLYAEEYFVHP